MQADCDRLVGDNLAMPVTWQGGDELNHEGSPVILRFQLRQAQLFGIEFFRPRVIPSGNFRVVDIPLY